MPKKKKTTTKKKSSGTAKGKGITIGAILLAIGGAIVIRYAAKLIPTFKGSPYVIAGVQLLGGYFLTRQKDVNMQGLGLGLVVSGGLQMVQATGLITGIGDTISYMTPVKRMKGYRDVPVVNGNGKVDPTAFPSPGVLGKTGAMGY